MENINQESTIDQQPPPPQPAVQNNGEKPSSKYKILGIIIIIFGFFQIPVPVGFTFFVIPQLTNLYQGLNIEQPNLLPTYLILIFLMTLGIVNIIIGVKLLLKSTQNKEKYFTIGIVAIILIFLSAGSSMAFTITSVITPIYKLTSELDSSPSPTIFQTPSPTPTINTSDISSWKTYTSSGLGFLFKYPQNWYIEENGETYIRVQNYDPKTAPGRGYSPAEDKSKYLIVVRSFTEKIYTIEEIKEKLEKDRKGYMDFDTIKEIKEKEIQINGYKALTTETLYSSSPSRLDAYIIDGKGNAIAINQGLDVEGSKTIFDQILSTFKFTDVSDSNSSNSSLCEIGKEYVSDSINPNPCQCSDGSKRTVVRMTSGVCPTGTNLRDCPASVFKCVD